MLDSLIEELFASLIITSSASLYKIYKLKKEINNMNKEVQSTLNSINNKFDQQNKLLNQIIELLQSNNNKDNQILIEQSINNKKLTFEQVKDIFESEILNTNLLTYNNNNSQTWNSWHHVNNKSRRADVFVYNNPKGGKSNPLIQFAVNIPKLVPQSKFKSDRIKQFFDMNSSLFNGRVYYIGPDKSGSSTETSRVNFAIYYNKINSDEIDHIIKYVVNHIIMVSIGLQQIP